MFMTCPKNKESGVYLAEPNEYDEIFAALKHPVRRQILLFIDKKSEASFTEIQTETGVDDTGLMSYHLKELSPLVAQSKRGKYCLSEVGQASVDLFRKVERERQRSSTVVRVEIERYLGETIKKSVFLLGIAGLTLMVPMSVDITLSVRGIVGNGFSSLQLAGMFLFNLFVMITGIVLFTIYDRHYFSVNSKTSIIHSTIFAAGLSVLSSLAFYSIYSFNETALATALNSDENLPLMFGVLRIVVFLVSTPFITYTLNRVYSRRRQNLTGSVKTQKSY
jgi:DNA-binding transcriptional ArsR family regulator